MLIKVNGQQIPYPDPSRVFDDPRTEEGRRRSSQNAIKHGLFAKRILMGDEKEEDFKKFLDDLNTEHKPVGPTEESLVFSLAQIEWRRRRIPNLETKAIDKAMEKGDTECKCVLTFSIYSNRLSREFQNTLKTLKTNQETRLKENGLNFRIAVIVWEYLKGKGVNWNPKEDGFVFSQEWLDKQLTLNDLLAAAFTNPNIRVTTKEMDQLLHKFAAWHCQYGK